MLIALNQLRRRHRQRFAAVLLVFALCLVVVAAHSALAERHMGTDMAVCLAIAQTAALAVAFVIATVAMLRVPMRARRWRSALVMCARVGRMPPAPRSRAGPAVLQVFLC